MGTGHQAERLRLAASRNRDLAVLQEMHRGREEQRDGRYSRLLTPK